MLGPSVAKDEPSICCASVEAGIQGLFHFPAKGDPMALSPLSRDSVLSIASKGSVLSIGSAGSVGSAFSAGSIASVFSAGGNGHILGDRAKWREIGTVAGTLTAVMLAIVIRRAVQ